jgi:hypothetical protein
MRTPGALDGVLDDFRNLKLLQDALGVPTACRYELFTDYTEKCRVPMRHHTLCRNIRCRRAHTVLGSGDQILARHMDNNHHSDYNKLEYLRRRYLRRSRVYIRLDQDRNDSRFANSGSRHHAWWCARP